MQTNHKVIMVLTIAAVIMPAALLCRAEQKKDEKSIWTEDEQRGTGTDSRRKMFELTDKDIDRIMTSLKKSDPEKAKELAKLREKDLEKFQMELRRYGREEISKIVRERIETFRQKRQEEFLQWLGKNYPKEAEMLAKIKEKEPDIYIEKSDYIRKKFWQIFEEERRNPELAEVLKEDLELKERRDELVRRIKAARNDKERIKSIQDLEEVASRRFDLIIQRKQLAYERLLKRLEQLQKQVKESRDEIAKWKDEKFKAENVKEHIKDLLEGIPKFRWD